MRSAVSAPPTPAPAIALRRRLPLTLWLGLAIVAVCELLLWTDVRLSGRGAIRTHAQFLAVPPPATRLGHVARWVAVNMTALAWLGYVVFLEGVLTAQEGRS